MTFIQARHYTATSGRQIDLIVIHDMEAPEAQNTAENVASWFAGSTAPMASSHWCHDQDSSVQCVLDKDIAYGAPGANHNGLHHEQSGYAAQTRDEWLDGPSDATMRNMAAKVAEECLMYNIPPVFVDAAGIRAGQRGITTHLEISRSGIGGAAGTHWDPGYEFPMDVFISYVLQALGGTVITPAPSVAESDVLKEGDANLAVYAWQVILRGAGYPIGNPPSEEPDGKFGPTTTASTKRWQSEVLGFTGSDVDGIVGPNTQRVTAAVLAWIAAMVAASNSVPVESPAALYPAWPLPDDHWFGPASSNPNNHSGFYDANDRAALAVWQGQMISRGWNFGPGGADGKYGPKTQEVVTAFQNEKALSSERGLLDAETWAAAWTAERT